MELRITFNCRSLMRNKTKIFTIITFSALGLVIGFALIAESLPDPPEERLLKQLLENGACENQNYKITTLKEGFLVEGCDNKDVYAECGCCDSFWFEKCSSPNDKKWANLCDPEVRSCIDNCMFARNTAGFDKEKIDSKDICKELVGWAK